MRVAALNDPSLPRGDEAEAEKPSCIKDPSVTRRKRLFLASVCLLFTTIGVIGFGVAFSLRSKSKASPAKATENSQGNTTGVRGSAPSDVNPISAPTTDQESLGIEQIIASEFGEDYFEDKTSIQYLALDWLMNEDRYQIDASAENLIQRFVMVTFYLQTSQEGEWKSCNPPKDKQTDACYHYFLIDALAEPWRYREMLWNRWLSGQHECDWAGVTCHFDKVSEIRLNGYNLGGGLPTELAKLDNLTQLSLAHNNLIGSIPREVGDMKNLTDIELQHNAFNGSIPLEFFNAESLTHINLASNDLTGTIPEEIVLLDDLGLLFLQDNLLSGNLARELFEVDGLEWLFLGNNHFSGSIPSEVGSLTNMVFFYAENNPLTGTLPSELGLLTEMREVDLHDTMIEGTIPDELYLGMSQYLNMLDLSSCQLSGTISPHIGSFNTLDWFLLPNNRMSGPVPKELGLVTSLRRLELQGNELSGSVPDDLCYLELGTLKADCSVLSSGEARVTCHCCTMCCDHETGVCLPQ